MAAMGPRNTLAGVMTAGLIIATVVTSHAQMKPDPKLAAMRSVFIVAEDDLSDAPGVAACFAEEVSRSLPLTPVADKGLSQAVLRFRPIENRTELSVLTPDNQLLWSGTAAVPRDRTVTLQARRCIAALELIEHLGSAMRCARDRLWYQQPLDSATESLLSTSAPHERQGTRFEVMSVSYQIIEANRTFWRYSWKMSVRNHGPDTVVVDPSMEFHNRDGFIVDTDDASPRAIRPQETVEIAGSALLNAGVAPTVTSGLGRVKLAR